MLYMYIYILTYVGKKEGREGVQNGEEEQRLYIFATPSFWDLGSKKNSKLDNIIIYFSYSSSAAAENISFRPLFM